MGFNRDNEYAKRRLKAGSWLALLSLALLQFSLASHQFDHPAGDLAESCDICVQLERFDDVLTDHASPTVETPGPVGHGPAKPLHVAALASVQTSWSRAPPVI